MLATSAIVVHWTEDIKRYAFMPLLRMIYFTDYAIRLNRESLQQGRSEWISIVLSARGTVNQLT